MKIIYLEKSDIQYYDGYIEQDEQGLSTLVLTNLNGEEVNERGDL